MGRRTHDGRDRMIYILIGILIFGFLLLGLLFFYMILKYRQRNHERRRQELQQQRPGDHAIRGGEGATALTPLPQAATPGQPTWHAKVIKLEELNDLFPVIEYGMTKHCGIVQPKTADSARPAAGDSSEADKTTIAKDQPDRARNGVSNTNTDSGLSEHLVESQRQDVANPNDYCAICLDALQEDSMVRRLTCNHMFHSTCIDPWLTGRTAQCPVCKTEMI
ncbi:hypothetical protein D8B26_001597 [Coccidioides posadasii str. Silveira]|uniref:RING-type domain-containing protein n=2 Tax=Coccidioides posadasii TaxID=199306 RepID=A0A0J6F7F5_COCPO|nr:hypothetical protein CPAG_01216 [Coccidioides posadasii RMSCC 3488]QVM06894.1 hypothetical protein D8B26_001597 [Coccidioides posadasii str. Silveira]